MIYDHNNAVGASVYDVDTGEVIRHVMLIDMDKLEVVQASQPLRVNLLGNAIETESIRFRSIYPIFGGQWRPQLFHCYGRVAQ